jgi:hypothetical protein
LLAQLPDLTIPPSLPDRRRALLTATAPHTFSAVTAQETTVLYVLSTLAQTCAALAAFVGAVGLYKLQLLRDESIRTERTIRGLMANLIGAMNADSLPTPQLIDASRAEAAEPNPGMASVGNAVARELPHWDDFITRRRRTTTTLVFFEAWNLIVIGASVAGFNYVPVLASNPWTPGALWVVALGTVAFTGGSVFMWTRE